MWTEICSILDLADSGDAEFFGPEWADLVER